MNPKLKKLDRELSRATSTAAKVAKLEEYYLEAMSVGSGPIINLSSAGTAPDPHQTMMRENTTQLMILVQRHNLHDAMKEISMRVMDAKDQHQPHIALGPLKHILCGNQDVSRMRFCEKGGTKICAACTLVLYCSAECQKAHWNTHKSDCKSNFRSDRWQPDWITENRLPSFVSAQPTNRDRQATFGMGTILWGNVPAIDILNLPRNEGVKNSRTRDFSIAFAASGDLRNFIKTINALPDNYEGHVQVCLNDHTPITVIRNVFILLILGLIEDEEEAAEQALQLWYSVFVPQSYIGKTLPIVMEGWKKLLSSESVRLSSNTNLTIHIEDMTRSTFAAHSGRPRITPDEANNALHEVMLADSRIDYRHRYYSRLEPSHRLAMLEWRRFGLVMPFGAVTAHLNLANRWLFSPDGRLFLYDSANPLDGWDIEEIIASGKKHGTTRADIMGCFHFHVKDQLLVFIKRMKRFKMDITMFDRDAVQLAKDIQQKRVTLGPFDRVEVSNIVDSNYVGVKDVLTHWGPLLSPNNPHSTLIGCFMNWISGQQGATSRDLSPEKLKRLTNIVYDRGLIRRKPLQGQTDPMLFFILESLDAFYDNSKAFKEYLNKVNAPRAAQAAGLSMRAINTIAPPRIGVPVGESTDTLPKFDTPEKWYLHMMLSGAGMTPRYVEWTKA